jgi:hypothetical protein
MQEYQNERTDKNKQKRLFQEIKTSRLEETIFYPAVEEQQALK